MASEAFSFRDYKRILRENRNFRLLWFAQIVSELGDWFYSLAVYSMLLQFTGKAESIALAFILQVLPQVLTSPAAGVLNDRISRKKIMRATTDSQPGVNFESKGAGVDNLLKIHQAFTEWTDDQMRAHFEGMRYGDLKKTVAEAVVDGLMPIQQRYQEITADPSYITAVLKEGALRVMPIAQATVELTKQRMGLHSLV